MVHTDVFQYLLFAVLLAAVAFSVTRGWVPDFSSMLDVQSMGIPRLVALPLLGAAIVFVAPDIWQRVYAGRDSRHARRGVALSACMVAVAYVSLTLLGNAARMAFPEIKPEEAALAGLTRLLPAPLVGLGAVLVFAVVMSSVDTTLFVLASSFSKDIWTKFIDKRTDPVRITRIGLVLFVCLALITSLFFQDILTLALSFLSIGVGFAPVVVGSFLLELKPKAVNLALGMSLLSVIGLFVAGYVMPETSVISLPVSLVFLVVGQLIFKRKPSDAHAG